MGAFATAVKENEKEKEKKEKSTVKAAPETVQRDLSDVNGPKGGMLPDDVSSRIQSMRGGGQRLSDRSLQHFSEKFGRDMSDVHVHTDVASDTISRSLNARAFTIGSDVFLTKGINPDGGGRDQETMTHELTHVVQQGGRAGYGSLKLGAADTAQEHEAASTAQREFDPDASAKKMAEEESETEATAQREFEEDAAAKKKEAKAEESVQREFEPEPVKTEAKSESFSEKIAESGAKDTIQRGFFGDLATSAVSKLKDIGLSIGASITGAAMDAFGLSTSYDTIFGGRNKVRLAVGKLTDERRSEFDEGEEKLKELEGDGPEGLPALEREIIEEMNEGDDLPTKSAVDNGDPQERYEKKYAEYEELLEKQLKIVNEVDESITAEDLDRFRSGTKENTINMFASALKGSFFGGFMGGGRAGTEMAKVGFANQMSSRKRKNILAAPEPAKEEEKEK